MAGEICTRAGLDASVPVETTLENSERLFAAFEKTMQEVKAEDYYPAIYYQKENQKENNRIVDFAVLKMQQFQGLAAKPFPSVSALLEGFYQERDNAAHIRQKAQDMRKLVTNHIERCVKKKEIQLKTRRETKGMDLWKKRASF